MYNLLVTAQVGAWDAPRYEFARNRFGEHTLEDILKKYQEMSTASVAELISFPAIFTYEGEDQPARFGYLRRISPAEKTLTIDYEIVSGVPALPPGQLVELRMELDISRGELYRTHWAVKDGKLIEVLLKAGLLKMEMLGSRK